MNIDFETLRRTYEFLQQQGIPFQSKVTLEFNLQSTPLITTSTATTETIENIPVEDSYVPIGMDILDKDKGLLRSFGYERVRELTVRSRRTALLEAVDYGNDPRYIQERLHYIAYIQPIQNPNPFQEDLEWFEKEFNLEPLPFPGE